MDKTILRISSNVNNIAKLEPFLHQIIDKHHVCKSRFADILISLTEAVNNAIIHGNQRDESKFVLVHMQLADQKVVFTVSDEGKGFNPSEVPDPTQADLIECCGGRGVFIIKSLADKVQYSDNGRSVRMQFKRQQSKVS